MTQQALIYLRDLSGSGMPQLGIRGRFVLSLCGHGSNGLRGTDGQSPRRPGGSNGLQGGSKNGRAGGSNGLGGGKNGEFGANE